MTPNGGSFESPVESFTTRKLTLTTVLQRLLLSGKQLRCVLCCERDHGEENTTRHRLGYKTRYECSLCKVALCQTSRWENDESCFDKFHSSAKLPDACQQAATKSRQTRAPPPLRKRSQASVEQFERRVTRHKSKPLRR
ncbi:hypothetical protein GN958_ATG06241, partial [Phytophthora infestans]